MKAIVCTRHGPPELLEYRDVPAPSAGPGQIVVAVHAASVNFPDLLVIQNKYQFKPPLPFVPGSELAGVVVEVAPDVTEFAPGDRVMAFTLVGAFAEQVAVEAARAVRVPVEMDLKTAAALLVTYSTMEHALGDRARLQPGETVLVLGAAGGIGLASIEIARAMGARVIAAASGEQKLAVCRACGAHETIDYTADDLRARLRALTGGRGPDVVVDPVGGPYTEPALRSIGWRGRFLVVGFASGEIPRLPLNLVLLKGCAVVGVFWGEFIRREPEGFRASVARLARWHAQGALKPLISAEYPLDRAADALRCLADRRAVGKVLLVHGAHPARPSLQTLTTGADK
jgi:NADPH2:quinone reductase